MYQEQMTTVKDIESENEQVQWLVTTSGAKRAVLYKELLPRVEKGDRVLVNTTATKMRLGTGGFDIAIHVEGQQCKKRGDSTNEKGHIMKARYLPYQRTFSTIEEEGSLSHEQFQHTFTLNKKPVLIAELHSMVILLWALVQELDSQKPIVVIISDEASLPLAMSEHVQFLKRDPLVTTITTGQAFGGEYEAVNVVTALQFAHFHAEDALIVITQGPGVVGTGTKYGFSGLAQAEWANHVGALDGLPIWVPRLSQKDQRNRHRGLSHHTYTPLTKFTHVPTYLPLPIDFIETRVVEIDNIKKHAHIHLIPKSEYEQFEDLPGALRHVPYPVTTMGRNVREDVLFLSGIAVAISTYFDLDPNLG
ncbi:DUF3866 family protein [Texcoconibacillus texcoconensis]|uniref:DUF3866 family protein n=1 Tax=Texcoconibacillus texcoconensis TaxID=1095777 RepID=A0A840QNP4_9BACI|nr:DUF3866 family protein [Texcoconibacillus texcoconensis]MBB5172994.1 hypothetical protein [Texcoconibacillus texcoconensis]